MTTNYAILPVPTIPLAHGIGADRREMGMTIRRSRRQAEGVALQWTLRDADTTGTVWEVVRLA